MSRTRAYRRQQKDRARARARRFMFAIKGHDRESIDAQRLVFAYTSDRRIGRPIHRGPRRDELLADLREREQRYEDQQG